MWSRIKALPGHLRAKLQKQQDTLPVVKKLRRRLTVVFILITGLVLSAVVSVSFSVSATQLDSTAMANFNNEAISAVYELLYNRDEVSIRASLEDLERNSNSIVYTTINGEDVEIEPQTETPTNREDLYWEAMDLIWSSDLDWSIGDSVIGVFVTESPAVAVESDEQAYTEFRVGVAGDNWAEYRQDELEYHVIYGAEAAQAGDSVVIEDRQSLPATGQGTMAQPSESGDLSIPAGELSGVDVTLEFSGQYIFSKAYTDDMVVYGQSGESYRMVYVDMVYEDDTDAARNQLTELLVLQPVENGYGEYVLLLLGYLALLLGGLLALGLMSYLLARIVTKPTAASLQRQAEFVAAASHELKSPLTVMRTSLSAARVAPTGEESERYQTNAEREAERMSRLVEDLLLLAGGDAGSWKLQSEAVDVDTLLIELDEQFRPVAKRAGNTLLLRLPEETLGEVRGDGDRLRQIVSVLLDNALQYAPEGTGVVLAGKRRKGRVEIDVIDHGTGIPDEEKERVFERFYRTDKSRTDKSHFGLGLSVARELAELHGGSLTLRDTGGGGATFRLTLPAAD